MKFAHSLETVVQPETLWNCWVDVKGWPSWDSELVSAQLGGAFVMGATGSLKPQSGPRSRFSLSQLAPGQSYTFTTQLPLCKLHVHRFLVPLDSGTRFTHEVSFTGPLAFLFGWLLGRRFRKVLPVVMENLRQQLEVKGREDG